jgi:hypothetical protein
MCWLAALNAKPMRHPTWTERAASGLERSPAAPN